MGLKFILKKADWCMEAGQNFFIFMQLWGKIDQIFGVPSHLVL